LIVDKPVHWLTIPGRLPDDPRPCLIRELQKSQTQPLLPVHRLDFEVSGLVLFAKSKAVQTRATAAFENRTVTKIYQALTSLGPDTCPQEFIWKFSLVRGKKRSFEAPHGREAMTEARCEAHVEGHFNWILRPKTGRSHQLRLSLARAGFPILGDSLYGSNQYYEGIALRAVHLQIDGWFDCSIPGLF
jgi:tRNA pseudouridine32 synthase/23S rRNA pseudouridine746 synthase